MSINFGHGVVLARLCEEESENLPFWRNEYPIRRWCRQYDLIDDINQKKWFEQINSDTSVSMFGIYLPDITGAPLGVCGLTSIDKHNRKAEFSLYIEPHSHNQGYGEQALKTLICHGFANLNLNRIWGETFEGNPGIRLYQKLGFVREGTLKETYFKAGRMIDSSIWAITRTEFGVKDWAKTEEVL